MRDALGATQSVLVLGGTSDIAVATVKQLVAQRTRKVVLAGRDPERLKSSAVEIEAVGGDVKVDVAKLDALDIESHSSFVDEQFRTHGEFDLVLLAFGVLGNQEKDELDNVAAAQVMQANYVGAASLLLPISQRMRQQGHGTIAVLSTVAAERARAANFIYGSSKAGLDAFCQGLGDSLVGSGVKLMVVRPGFVKTKMTADMGDKPMATTADAVATDLVAGLKRGSETVWSPAKLRVVFSVMRHLPRPIFRRIKA